MSQKEIKIEIPAGYEINQQLSTFEKIVFKEVKKDIIERVKSFDDACREEGTTEKEFKQKYAVLDAQGYAAEQLKLGIRVLNEGWAVDWDNSNEYKYIVYYDMRGKGSLYCVDCYYTYTSSAASFYYKSEKLAEYGYTIFEDIYRTYFKK